VDSLRNPCCSPLSNLLKVALFARRETDADDNSVETKKAAVVGKALLYAVGVATSYAALGLLVTLLL